MESSDGFRRRAAITVTPVNRSLFSRETDNAEVSKERMNRTSYIKFNKINEENHNILKNRKK